MYTPLHVHTDKGSVGDSILRIPDYISRAKEYGLPAIAITDHGSLSAVYSFYESCKKEGIKPIIGCEVYLCDDNTKKDSPERQHLVLLAKNNIGFSNLIALTNNASIDGFYYKPRTDLKQLKKYHEGLICLSACIAGPISKLVLADKKDEARTLIKKFKSIFGNDFYLEIQPGPFNEQILVNYWMIYASKEEGLADLVVTNDIHYLNEEDSYYHDIHCKINRSLLVSDPLVYPDTCYWFMQEQDILDSFKEYPQYYDLSDIQLAINNANDIAAQCNVVLNNEIRMPKYTLDENKTEEEMLTEICYNKFRAIENTLKDPARYIEQMLYEIDVICDLGFAGYFLMVRDFVQYAYGHSIPVGPGRGSICGSVVAFLADISCVDPIKYGLLFERFLSRDRKGSIPDIDLDFSSEERHLMHAYAFQKYGIDHCSFVSTRQLRKARKAIRDVGRVLGIDLKTVDKIAKLIPESYYEDDGEKADKITISDCLRWIPEFAEYKKNYPELFDVAEKLEGLPTSSGTHAAGVLISPEALPGILPLIRSEGEKEGYMSSSLDLHDSEMAGLVKFDFLSIGSLSVYQNTENDVGFKFDYVNNEYDDTDTWNLLGSRFTTGVFQVSSFTYKKRMQRLRPKNLFELAACLALVRGPCIMSGMDEQYMQILEGKKQIKKLHPFYDSVTESTNGVILYQEQIMQIIVNFGFDISVSYKVMKWVAKKKIKELAAFEEKLKEAGHKHSVPDDVLDTIWKLINDQGLYCFNSSHAFAYAMLCYRSAYLKVHYPAAFLKNTLTKAYLDKAKTKDKKIRETLADIRRLKINILPPDINTSLWHHTLEDGAIRLGFCSIKTFGNVAAQEVLEKRGDNPFSSFSDFYSRVAKNKCNKAKVSVGTFAGIFDSIEPELDRRDISDLHAELSGNKDLIGLDKIKIGKETVSLSQEVNLIAKKILNL